MIHVICKEHQNAVGFIAISDKLESYGLGDTPHGRGTSTDDLDNAAWWCRIIRRCGCTSEVYNDKGQPCVVEDGEIITTIVSRGLVLRILDTPKPKKHKKETVDGSR